MTRVQQAAGAGRTSTAAQAGARAIAWSTLLLVVVCSAVDVRRIGPLSAITLRAGVLMLGALVQVVAGTRFGARRRRLLLACVPAAVAAGAALAIVSAAAISGIGVTIDVTILAVALLPWISVQWSARAACVLGAAYVAALVLGTSIADGSAVAGLVSPLLIRAVLEAAAPILLVVGAAVAWRVDGDGDVAAPATRDAALVELAETALAVLDAAVL